MQFNIGDEIMVVDHREVPSDGSIRPEDAIERRDNFVNAHRGKTYIIKTIESDRFYSITTHIDDAFHPEEVIVIKYFSKYKNGTLNQGGNL